MILILLKVVHVYVENMTFVNGLSRYAFSSFIKKKGEKKSNTPVN